MRSAGVATGLGRIGLSCLLTLDLLEVEFRPKVGKTRCESSSAIMFNTIHEFLYFYKTFLLNHWNSMGPREYVTILTLVGVVGWYMMRKASTNV